MYKPYRVFTMDEVAYALGLSLEHVLSDSSYFDCVNPNCTATFQHKKFNINFRKNKFHCFKCGCGGGPLSLYMVATGLPEAIACQELYRILDGEQPVDFKPRPKPIPMAEKERSDEDKDMVYRAYLSMLPLCDRDRASLMKRGLTEKDIQSDGYKSAPIYDLEKLAKRLLEMGCDLEGIPGFFLNYKDQWVANMLQPGYYIPVKNARGQIVALQLGTQNRSPKYMWFTSTDHKMGCAVQSPIHHVGSFEQGSVFITEGYLKANVAYHLAGQLGYDLSNFSLLAMSGINTQTGIEAAMARAIQRGGIDQFVEALDKDKEREDLAKHRLRLWERMQSVCAGTTIGLGTMNPEDFFAKGLDDHLKYILDHKLQAIQEEKKCLTEAA